MSNDHLGVIILPHLPIIFYGKIYLIILLRKICRLMLLAKWKFSVIENILKIFISPIFLIFFSSNTIAYCLFIFIFYCYHIATSTHNNVHILTFILLMFLLSIYLLNFMSLNLFLCRYLEISSLRLFNSWLVTMFLMMLIFSSKLRLHLLMNAPEFF